jgi:hypothetical protein
MKSWGGGQGGNDGIAEGDSTVLGRLIPSHDLCRVKPVGAEYLGGGRSQGLECGAQVYGRRGWILAEVMGVRFLCVMKMMGVRFLCVMKGAG